MLNNERKDADSYSRLPMLPSHSLLPISIALITHHLPVKTVFPNLHKEVMFWFDRNTWHLLQAGQVQNYNQV